MNPHDTHSILAFPAEPSNRQDPLTDVLREGARSMLIAAIEAEARQWIDERAHLTDEHGRRLVVRNGRQPTRFIQTPLGDIEFDRPRVHDRRRGDDRETFTSKILPPYLRRTKNVEELIPWLYLKGVSTGDFGDALQSLLGPDAPGLSATTVTRLIQSWQDEHAAWSRRSLEDKHYVYIWADGIHFTVRLGEPDNKKQCILVMMGAKPDGTKELIAVQDGFRESEHSWLELLRDLKRRGLSVDPKVAVADGALGFWAAMRKVWPGTTEQRCWVHKTANVLNNLPKSQQPHAKDRLHAIWMAPTREEAHAAFDAFVEDYSAKYEKAALCLKKDRDALLAFYDYPAEHWKHLRTTNPIESTFATVRLRHRRTKGNGSRRACLSMVFKLAESAQKRWRKLNGYQWLPDVIRGVEFTNGIRKDAA